MGEIKDTAEAVKGIVEAVPVYQDGLQPAVRELGLGLQTVAKTVHIALAPVAALVWSYDKIKDFLSTRVAEKLRGVPSDRIITPEPHVVVPALTALVYTAHQETLRELYANLLATSLDRDTCSLAHPAFVDIIKNMSPDEARIMRLFSARHAFPVLEVRVRDQKEGNYQVVLRNFSFIGKEAGCSHPDFTPNYLNNLSRLGLLEIPVQTNVGSPTLAAPNTYEPLESDPEVLAIKEKVDQSGSHTILFQRGMVFITNFGAQFCRACVIERSAINALGS